MTGEAWLGSERLWQAMAVHLWQSSIVLLLVVLVALLMRRAPAGLVAALWSLAVVKLWLPLEIFGGLTSALLERVAAHGPEGGFAVTVWAFYPAEFYRALPVASSGTLPGWLGGLLTLLWLGGMLAIWISRTWRGRASRGVETRLLDGSSACVALLRVAHRAGISADDLRVTSARVLPLVRGIVRPRVIVPLHLIERLDDDELGAVLLHEEEHRRRRDPLRFSLLSATATVFWFYPPIWWLARRVREATEAACDEAAIRAGVASDAYRDSLVHTIHLGLVPAGTPVSIRGRRSSALVRRLRRLDEFGRIAMTPRHRVYFAAISLALVASAFLPLSGVSSPPALAGEPGPPSPAPRPPDLDRLAHAGALVTLDLRDAPIEEILAALATQLPGLAIRPAEALPGGQRASIEVRNVPLRQALQRLGKDAGLTYEVPDPRTLIVRSVRLVADGVTPPTLVYKVEPTYPEKAREQGLTAKVILEAVIGEDGSVTELKLLRNTASEHAEFADSAIAAVSQWRYDAAKLPDGRPVAVYFTVFIEFALSDSPPRGEAQRPD